jgi:hypothetical protein
MKNKKSIDDFPSSSHRLNFPRLSPITFTFWLIYINTANKMILSTKFIENKIRIRIIKSHVRMINYRLTTNHEKGSMNESDWLLWTIIVSIIERTHTGSFRCSIERTLIVLWSSKHLRITTKTISWDNAYLHALFEHDRPSMSTCLNQSDSSNTRHWDYNLEYKQTLHWTNRTSTNYVLMYVRSMIFRQNYRLKHVWHRSLSSSYVWHDI